MKSAAGNYNKTLFMNVKICKSTVIGALGILLRELKNFIKKNSKIALLVISHTQRKVLMLN